MASIVRLSANRPSDKNRILFANPIKEFFDLELAPVVEDLDAAAGALDLGVAGAFQQMVNQVGVAIGIQVMLAVQTAREASEGAVPAFPPGTRVIQRVSGARGRIGRSLLDPELGCYLCLVAYDDGRCLLVREDKLKEDEGKLILSKIK